MKKKGFVFLLLMLFMFGLVACVKDTTTTTTTATSGTTTTTTTTSGTTSTTTTTTAAFSIALSGLTDVGFTDEDKLLTGEYFDLLDGVHAYGSDGVDYKDNILLQSDDAACQIVDKQLLSNTAKVCTITYTVVVNSKLARENRLIKVSAAPVTIEFTETDLFDNDALFATDYVVTTDDPGVNKFHYWQESAAVLGTTGYVKIEGGKLMISQESMGGVGYALQVIALTEVPLEKGKMYKITLTITSSTDRVIDIVTKAPNNDYANDTHSLIEITAGTADYEMFFTANQDTLHLNIMTGAVEGNLNVGDLEFSNFTLWEGPKDIQYVELDGFFTNTEVASGTDIEFITTTDSDYVRLFYYWDNGSGNMMSGVTTDGGVDITINSVGSSDWENQLQWNDINKAGTPLIVGANYKLTFDVNSAVARNIRIDISGKSNSLATSTQLTVELKAGANSIEVPFVSLYDYFFMKVVMGNFGDLESTGLLQFSNFHLYVDKDATPAEEPVDDGAIIGNVFGDIVNVNADPLPVENIDFGYLYQTDETTDVPSNTFYFWYGMEATGWFSGWTQFPSVTGDYTDGLVNVDIAQNGPEFWSIQLKYKGGETTVGVDYAFSFVVYSEVARTINVQIKDAGFNTATVSEDIVLVAGYNYVELPYTAEFETFNVQFNLGTFSGDADDTGTLSFTNFVVSRPTQLVEGFFINGDFAEDSALANPDAVGWAYWSTTGATWLGENDPEYLGSIAISGGVMTAVTTQTGHQIWACQIQYNHDEATMTVGAVYKVEFDVNASIATHIVAQLKTEGDASNKDVYVELAAGDNHVTVFFVAQQETFRMFLLLGFTDPSTLVFDNFQLSEPIAPVVVPDETVYVKSTTPILNGDFNAEGFAVGAEGSSWTSWNTIGQGSWTTEVGSNISIVDGAVVLETLGTGDYVWSIQLQYRPAVGAADVVAGNKYKVEFDVNASVAGTFSFELTTTDNAGNIAFPVTLVVGDNHVVVEFVAFEANLKLTACVGQYGAATLIFDNFELFEEAEYDYIEVYQGIDNGDFNTEGFAVGGEGSSWTSWNTIGQGSWTTEVGSNISVVDGAVVVETLGTGDYVWSIQLQYRPAQGLKDVVAGDEYRVEFDVNASVAGTFSFELTTTDNAGNIAFPVTLVVGANHVVVEFVAFESNLKLTACVGQYGAATLTFDNFKLYHNIPVNEYVPFVASDIAIVNGDFNAEGFAVGAEGSSWTSWTTIGQGSWTTEVGANFNVVDGAVVVETLGTGDYVWSIQFSYRPADGVADVVPGVKYRVEFDVNASVAGTFSFELTTTNNVANKAFPITLAVGDNHVVVEFFAWESNLKLTACLGQYGAATLTFDNFKLYEPAQFDYVTVPAGIVDGDFSAEGFAVGAEGSAWTSWTTIGQGSWTTEVGANFTVVDGAVAVETLGTGDYVWSIQFSYRPAEGVADVIPGDMYKVEFDVNATVAGTFSFELTTTGNAANVATPVTLVEGANHVVVYIVAYEANLKLTACVGQYGAATLTFDNFVLSHYEVINGPVIN